MTLVTAAFFLEVAKVPKIGKTETDKANKFQKIIGNITIQPID